MQLAMALAQDHVPGFRFAKRKPGAPYNRAEDDIKIYFGVKKLVAERQGIANACRISAKRGVVGNLSWKSIRQLDDDGV